VNDHENRIWWVLEKCSLAVCMSRRRNVGGNGGRTEVNWWREVTVQVSTDSVFQYYTSYLSVIHLPVCNVSVIRLLPVGVYLWLCSLLMILNVLMSHWVLNVYYLPICPPWVNRPVHAYTVWLWSFYSHFFTNLLNAEDVNWTVNAHITSRCAMLQLGSELSQLTSGSQLCSGLGRWFQLPLASSLCFPNRQRLVYLW